MWVAAKILDPTDHCHYLLKCLDITTGAILATSTNIGASEDHAVLEAETALQRPGLLLANNMIYLAFGRIRTLEITVAG